MTRDATWRQGHLPALGWRRVGARLSDAELQDVTLDSRMSGRGVAFCARAGERDDGHRYLEAARARGAEVFFVEHAHALPAGWSEETWVGSAAEPALHALGGAIHGWPLADLVTLGVTGTNGKTSVVRWTAAILAHAGVPAATVGTLGFRCGAIHLEGANTTPDALTLHRWAANARAAGARVLAMEASSHGIALGRVAPAMFDVAGYTGLGRDHLDFHGTLEAYRDTKARLFREGLRGDGVAVLWADDAHAASMEAAVPGGMVCRRVASARSDVDLRIVQDTSVMASRTRCTLVVEGRETVVEVPAVGLWVAANAGLALVLAAAAIDCSIESLVDGLSVLPGIAGRMEHVPHPGVLELEAYVDYAHTPDALECALQGLRRSGVGLWVVFGCGGDRDRGKRPLMAACAEALADGVIVTSDNPRSESPQRILDEVLTGVASDARVLAVLDRREAIARAVEEDGVLLVAGKGHERGQIVGARTFAFDDRQELRRALAARAMGRNALASPWLWGLSVEDLADVVGGLLQQGPSSMPCGSFFTDSRKPTPWGVFVAISGQRFDGHDFVEAAIAAGARTLVVERAPSASISPDVAVVLVSSSIEAMARLAAWSLTTARTSAPTFATVAITGSNGKTTTKEWCAAFLGAFLGGPVLATPGNFNNDIGMPLTVEALAPCHRGAVLELGASRPGDIERLALRVCAEVAVVSSVGASHLEGLGSMEGVRRTKAGIVAGGRTRALVLPWSERNMPAWQDAIEAAGLADEAVWTVGPEDGATLRVERTQPAGPVRLIGHRRSPLRDWDVVLDLPLPGLHHGCNAASALLGAWLACQKPGDTRLSLSVDRLRSLLANVVPPGGRWHVVAQGGYRWIDDAYNANPASVAAALDLLAAEPGERVAVLGEMRELGEGADALHAQVGAHAAACADVVLGVGPAALPLVESARRAGARADHVKDAHAAATWVREHVPLGATLLLKGSRSIALERVLQNFVSSAGEN